MARRFGTRSISALTAFLLCTAAAVPAGAANPELTAQVRGIEDEKARSSALRIEAMDIAVRLHGGIAETVVTARFHNPGKDILEGRFRLQMPGGSVVTGYALDVGGEMIEGVLLDQLEARRAYEAQVRQNIDPGLGEVSRDFQFSTRVYPVAPGSSRTVRVRFVTPIAAGGGYVLPLDTESTVGRVSVSLSASGGAAPGVRLPEDGKLWTQEGGRLAWQAQGVPLKGELAITPAPGAGPIAVGAGPQGERFFEIADSAPATPGEAARTRSVAVLWDRSLSRADDDLAGEIALLRAWLEAMRPAAIELILFDASGLERVTLTDAASVAARLASVRYRGASSYAPLSALETRADTCLLFTDGLVTIDRRAAFTSSCPLTAVFSARDADRAALAAMAAASGGEALRLTADNGEEILKRLTSRGARVVRVRSTAGAPIDAARLEAPGGGWRLVGPMPASGGVVVTLSGTAPEESERVYSVPAAEADWSGAASLWAADRVAVRAAAGQESREALLAFARRYSVAGPDISFLVLETAEDYARSKIEPPANFPAEGIARYRDLAAEHLKDEAQARENRIASVIALWEAQKKWWGTRFDPRAKADPDELASEEGGGSEPVVDLPPPPPPPPPAPAPPPSPPPPAGTPQPPAEPTASAADENFESAGEIVVTGMLLRAPNLHSAAPVTGAGRDDAMPAPPGQEGEPASVEAAVATAPWASTRPYMKALRSAAPAARERVFAEQQAVHGALPAFWFDVAELAWKEGRQGEARRRLLSALDLPARNNETLAIVAERLFRYGEQDRAIEMFEAVAAAESRRPQPLRSLALALARRSKGRPAEQARADLARAIDLLTQVIMTPWDDDFDGIERISLMEVNALIGRYRALGGDAVPLDPRLVALLDVDVRVVIEWNTEETDLDLWVDEPNGERAIFSNQETTIGGRMSPDMTDGYGPEEYLLRRAPAGTFTVRADVYSADELNPNGASRITARLIRNFGRPEEKEEIVEIELLPDSEDEEDGEAESGVRLLGKIRVRR